MLDLNSISLAEFGLLLAASAGGWIFIAWRCHSKKQPLLAQSQGPVFPIGLFDIFVLILLWGGSQALGQVVFLVTHQIPLPEFDLTKLSQQQFHELTLTVKSFEAVGLSLAFVFLILRYRGRVGQFLTVNFWDNVKIGLVAGILILPWVLLVHLSVAQLVPYQHGTLKSIEKDPSLSVILIAWCSAVLYAPIAEEFFCRVGIQSWLRRFVEYFVRQLDSLIKRIFMRDGTASNTSRTDSNEEFNSLIAGGVPKYVTSDSPESGNDSEKSQRESWEGSWKDIDPQDNSISPTVAIAMIVTAGFFGFLHLGQGLALIPLFVMALALGYIFEKTRSLIPCIIVHFLLNAHSMAWATLRSYWSQ